MKLASLLIPAYLPRAYASATPAPYQSSTIDAFERELVKISPFVIRNPNATRLLGDEMARFVHQQIVMRYDIMVDPESTSLGDAVVLALSTFKLEKVAVVFANADAEELALGDAEELQSGLHPWNGEQS